MQELILLRHAEAVLRLCVLPRLGVVLPEFGALQPDRAARRAAVVDAVARVLAAD